MTDPNVEAVCAKLRERAALGLRKYGVTTDKAGLSRRQWTKHAQEEAMDLAIYLENLLAEEFQMSEDGTAELELVEKVAEAIKAAMFANDISPVTFGRDYHWTNWQSEARAAIAVVVEAMREPTRAALRGAYFHTENTIELMAGRPEPEAQILEIWQHLLAEFERSAPAAETREG